MFYGRQDDRKHYEKIARGVEGLDSKFRAEVFAGQFPRPRKDSQNAKSGLLIRVYEIDSSVGWTFWVNPVDENWVFLRSMKFDGKWEHSPNERAWHVGSDLWHWKHEEDLVHYRNFPLTTARLFFRDGPLGSD